jgi:hypothetical protein
VMMVDTDDCGFVLSWLPLDGVCFGFEDLSRLFCCVDGLPCRDFVHCFRFRFVDSMVSLVWVCHRFRKRKR